MLIINDMLNDVLYENILFSIKFINFPPSKFNIGNKLKEKSILFKYINSLYVFSFMYKFNFLIINSNINWNIGPPINMNSSLFILIFIGILYFVIPPKAYIIILLALIFIMDAKRRCPSSWNVIMNMSKNMVSNLPAKNEIRRNIYVVECSSILFDIVFVI